MEDQRSTRSGIFSIGDDRANAASISKTAALSVFGLVLVVGWLLSQNTGTSYTSEAVAVVSAAAETGPDLSSIGASVQNEMATSDIAMIGPVVVGELVAQYQTLKNNDAYTPAAASAAAEQLGKNIFVQVPYKQYAPKDIHAKSDTSYEAMLRYRGELKDALASIAAIKEYELGIFAKYSETKDPSYLDQLQKIVADYQAATNAAANLSVPSDAAALHAAILNAMGEFGVVLQGLADNANDPITVMTLLRSYNEAESGMVTSFNNLAMYFAHHPQT